MLHEKMRPSMKRGAEKVLPSKILTYQPKRRSDGS